jgi:hypothetical protein
MILTAVAIFELARNAGFPPVVAVTMTAIALRESGGDASLHNGNAASGDDSWGLWQINMLSPQVAALAKANGIVDEKQLLDPATNARIAHALWGGHNNNLNIAWYIGHGGSYQAKYEAHLPAAQWAALQSALGVT